MRASSGLALLLAGVACSTWVMAAEPVRGAALSRRLIYAEDFARPLEFTKDAAIAQQKKLWRTAWGAWSVSDGALRGAQVPGQKSGNALYWVPFRDAVIQFDVRLDGCRKAYFIVNDAQEGRTTGEHICRVAIDTAGFSAQKDDHDHDGPDKVRLFGRIDREIATGQWKTVTIEFVGERMVASIDGLSVAGSDMLIARPKILVGFVVTGESARFRNLKIWETEPAR